MREETSPTLSHCSSLGKTRRRMAKLVYNLLSMQELRRRLKECHLPTQGSREQLVRRHQDFTHMYNAQCDSLTPKTGEDHRTSGDQVTSNRVQRKVSLLDGVTFQSRGRRRVFFIPGS